MPGSAWCPMTPTPRSKKMAVPAIPAHPSCGKLSGNSQGILEQPMDSSKLAVKFFATDASALHAEVFVPIFHKWIQTRALPDHLLIDVADYKHVPAGPGTVLVAHEANLSIDQADNRLGLLYAR